MFDIRGAGLYNDAMLLFDKIPDRFFSILTSTKKELYVEALFVLRTAFQTELLIRREDLTAMLVNSMEGHILEADFSEEEAELEEAEPAGAKKPEASDLGLSAKAHLLIRKLRDTGWIEIEYESNSFEETITVPDYAIDVMNLLYSLSQDRVREYNSYVYATYAALKNSAENTDYLYQALRTAYQNTVRLVEELKLLFNNIRRYHQRISESMDVNDLLSEHFDKYKEQIIDTVYYPLKTIDSVPRFKHAIIGILNEWLLDDRVLQDIAGQGVLRKVYRDEAEGREDVLSMINFVADTFDSIEGMIADIDRRHTEYTNASIDRIRYQMNTDRSAKGKLIALLKAAGEEMDGERTGEVSVVGMLQDSMEAFRHGWMDMHSLYARAKRSVRRDGKPMPLDERQDAPEVLQSFLMDVRRQYSTPKIDAFILRCFGERGTFSTEEAPVRDSESFILFLLGTIRGREKKAPYTVDFLAGNVDVNGYSLPGAVFRRKTGAGQAGKEQ